MPSTIIEESSSSSSDEKEEVAASHIHRAALRSVRPARRHHEQEIERTISAVQRTQHMKELADEMASWVTDADRQLERIAASLDRGLIAGSPVQQI